MVDSSPNCEVHRISQELTLPSASWSGPEMESEVRLPPSWFRTWEGINVTAVPRKQVSEQEPSVERWAFCPSVLEGLEISYQVIMIPTSKELIKFLPQELTF